MTCVCCLYIISVYLGKGRENVSAREIPGAFYSSETKNKILDEATKLFALKGFGSVSMRDIGNEAGVKMSTIYYYYEGKEALFEDIMVRFENGYRHYFEWLREENEKAATLDELMDNMFNKEIFEMVDPIICLSISLAIKEQHNIPSARKRVFNLFFKYSVHRLKSDFDSLIHKGVIPPNDTETISRLFMNSVMVMNDMLIHAYIGNKPPINRKKEYLKLKEYLTCALTQGIR